MNYREAAERIAAFYVEMQKSTPFDRDAGSVDRQWHKAARERRIDAGTKDYTKQANIDTIENILIEMLESEYVQVLDEIERLNWQVIELREAKPSGGAV